MLLTEGRDSELVLDLELLGMVGLSCDDREGAEEDIVAVGQAGTWSKAVEGGLGMVKVAARCCDLQGKVNVEMVDRGESCRGHPLCPGNAQVVYVSGGEEGARKRDVKSYRQR